MHTPYSPTGYRYVITVITYTYDSKFHTNYIAERLAMLCKLFHSWRIEILSPMKLQDGFAQIAPMLAAGLSDCAWAKSVPSISVKWQCSETFILHIRRGRRSAIASLKPSDHRTKYREFLMYLLQAKDSKQPCMSPHGRCDVTENRRGKTSWK